MQNGKNGIGGLREVLDTNVSVSAFHSRHGTLVPLWKQAQAGYAVIVSPFIIREVARVIPIVRPMDFLRTLSAERNP